MRLNSLTLKVFCFLTLITNTAYANTGIELQDGIFASTEKLTPEKLNSADLQEDQYLLRVKIGTMSQQQFNSLKETYNNSSSVGYDSSKTYYLTDFLPPFAQAFNNKLMPPIYYSYDYSLLEKYDQAKPMVKNDVEVSSNCWNTSVEYLMSLHGISKSAYLYIADMDNVSSFFSNNSEIVLEEDPKVGDVLVVSEIDEYSVGRVIQHTAVIIGPNLVFEKVSPGEDAPFRISYLSDIKNKFQKLMTDPDWEINPVKFTYHRFKTENIKRVDLDSMGLIYYEPIPKELAKELVTIHPEVDPQTMLQTCFPRLGGGCDPFISQLKTIDLKINESSNLYEITKENKGMFIDL